MPCVTEDPFDVLKLVKEAQLQHGLRSEDYGRYHKYLTGRLATLRRQLSLKCREGLTKKAKFVKKEVTPAMVLAAAMRDPSSNVNIDSNTAVLDAASPFALTRGPGVVKRAQLQHCGGGRYLELLALNTERCWAAYEEAVSDGSSSSRSLVVARKHTNRALQWASKLNELAKGVVAESASESGSKNVSDGQGFVQYVLDSCEGYWHEMCGRCAVVHDDDAGAKEAFVHARECYVKAVSDLNEVLGVFPKVQVGVEQSYSLLAAKVAELDDRIVYATQQSGGDITSHQPPPVPALRSIVAQGANAGSSSSASSSPPSVSYLTDHSSIRWIAGACDDIPVYNIKVKEALREAARADPFTQVTALTKTPNTEMIAVGQQLRVLDAFDRTIGLLNDALAHARQEQRAVQGDTRKRQLQRLALFLQYVIGRKTADRSLFLLEVYARRLWRIDFLRRAHAPARQIAKIPPASPLELVRLYASAHETLIDLTHLPGIDTETPDGVSVGDTLEQQALLCNVGQLLYAGLACSQVSNTSQASTTVQVANSLLPSQAPPPTEAAAAEPFGTGAACAVAISYDSLRTQVQRVLLTMTAEENLVAFRASQAARDGLAGGAAGGVAATTGSNGSGSSSNSNSSAGSSSSGGAPLLIDSLDELVAASGTRAAAGGAAAAAATRTLVEIPPPYQPIPCKPVFVDVALTYVDYGVEKKAAAVGAAPAPTANTTSATTASKAKSAESDTKKKEEPKSGGGSWLGAWGWGKKS